MSDLQLQNLYNFQATDVLTTEETSLVVGGAQFDNVAYGGSGNDYIHGSSGNDYIHGGAGNDTLIGGGGNDALYGGAGDDLLIANILANKKTTVHTGWGNDTVVFQ